MRVGTVRQRTGRRALTEKDFADRRAAQPWLKLAALVLVIAALGLPVNDLFRYALLVVATVAVVAGTVAARPAPWLGAIAAVALCVLGQILFPAPRIEEGHNVFLVDRAGGALEAGLPRDAFARMAAEFDAKYPPARRCRATQDGCWRGQGFPPRAFAFSADGILEHPAYSRRVTGIDFSDPVRLRQLLEPGLALIASAAVLALLVWVRPRRLVLPFALIAATLLVALFNDASFIGGMRPFDSGDDGLVYDGYARDILRRLVAGDVAGALQGGEAVFYFTPGLRYLRAAEHIFFGETYLGYLSLILLLPFLVFALTRRFVPLTCAIALTLIFAAIPVGVGFGSRLLQHAKLAGLC